MWDPEGLHKVESPTNEFTDTKSLDVVHEVKKGIIHPKSDYVFIAEHELPALDYFKKEMVKLHPTEEGNSQEKWRLKFRMFTENEPELTRTIYKQLEAMGL